METTGGIGKKTIETSSFAMDCFWFGRGGKTLTILPGMSVQSVMPAADLIAETYWALADEYTIYVMDRRRELPAAYPIAAMAEDTATALRSIGIEKTSFFGASQGGMIAMEIAVRYPEQVENLILGSTSARVTEKQFRTFANWIRLVDAGDAEDLFLAMGKEIYPEWFFETIRDPFLASASSVTKESMAHFRILAEAMRGFDITDRLGQVRCPVFLVGDKKDPLFDPEAFQELYDCLGNAPGFETYLYEGYGHAFFDTAPDFAERMLHFLKQQG